MSDEVQDVEVAESSAAEEPQQSDAPAPQETAADPAEKPESKPFHEHPRFQELIENNRSLKETNKAFEQRLAQMQSQFESSRKAAEPQQKDELLERLRGIDPEFAKRIERINDFDKVSKEIEELRSWRNESTAERVRQEATSTVSRFYEEQKVPQERRAIYDALVRHTVAGQEAQMGRAMQVNELPAVLKSVHEQINKTFTATQREATKQLVEGKRADAKRPVPQPKGQQVPNPKGPDYSKLSKSDAKAQIISDILAETRASKDV